ncbi:MAG: ExeM/NucH family extracellular endonuclease [Pseudomonadota bacterium]
MSTFPSIKINEVLGSTASTDVEYIEIVGPAGASLEGLSVIVVESDDEAGAGMIDRQIDFGAGDLIGDNGFFLAGNSLVNGTYAVTPDFEIPDNAIENSAYTLALVETASIAGDAVTEGITVIDALGVADAGEGNTFFFGAPVIGPDGSFLPAGAVRVEDGVDTDSAADWTLASFSNNSPPNTPTAAEFDSAGGGGDPEALKIHEVQGSGAASTRVGETVILTGVVTRVFLADDQIGGFFLQEEDSDADGDATTSEGIFVISDLAASELSEGQIVTVTGDVTETAGETRIVAETVVVDDAGDNSGLVAATDLFGTNAEDREQLEGMLVSLDEVTVTETFYLERDSQYIVSQGGLLEQYTQSVEPGSANAADFEAWSEANANRSIFFDDGSNRGDLQNPAAISVIDGNDGVLGFEDTFTMGDTLTGVTGVLSVDIGAFDAGGLVVRGGRGTYANTDLAQDTPPDVGGDIQVASLNVLNFFTTLDEGDNETETGDGPRGADTASEFERQLDKLVTHILTLDADIIGLQELENSSTDAAVTALVDALNAQLGEEIYAFVGTGLTRTGAPADRQPITNGIIYQSDVVSQVGDTAVLDTGAFVDPNETGAGRNRPAVTATFENEDGATVTVSSNHLKSKGSSGLSAGDAGNPDSDQGDGQGFWNDTRAKAAAELADWLDGNPTGVEADNTLIVGDLNAYAGEDPVKALLDAGYLNTVAEQSGTDEYGYVFAGEWGTLDYIMGIGDAFDGTEGSYTSAIWNANAPFPTVYGFDESFQPMPPGSQDLFDANDPFRASDHSPVLIGLDIDAEEPAMYTLELLHFTDQEANASTIDNIDNLSAVLTALRDQDLGDDGLEDNSITLSSGDVIIPGLFFDASEAVFGSAGIADIQIQNELGLQAAALGNHEFDLGTAFLGGLIDGTATGDFSALSGTAIDGLDFAGAAFPYLSTNLDFSTDPDLAPLEVDGGNTPEANTVTSSVVIEEGGELIGVVGAITPTLRGISSPGDDLGISPQPFDANPTEEQIDALAAEIQAEVDAVIAANEGLDKVILLSHMQRITIEFGLAERLENVDIIVAGGSNTRLFDENDRIRDGDSNQGVYPQFFENAGGTMTAVVNTDAQYKYVGRLVIDFDEDGNILPGSYDADVSGAYATDDIGVADLNAGELVDPEIDAITDAIQNQIVATESNVFGVSDVFLNGNRFGVADDPADTDGVRTQETNLGNLTADANLVYANQMIAANDLGDPVVVSIKNGGGIRANIGEIVVPGGSTEPVRLPNGEVLNSDGEVVKPVGGISQNDIASTLAFNNGLTLLDITAEELVATLEGAVGALPEVSGGFPQISGVKFSFDPDALSGDRIESAGIFNADGTLISELVRDGEIVGDGSDVYRIVTLNFLANGGDPILSTLSAPNRVDLIDINGDGEDDGIQTGAAVFADDGTEQDALAEYLNDNFNPETGGTAFSEEDTGRDTDARIQNLGFREDDIFGPGGEFDISDLAEGEAVDEEFINGIDPQFFFDGDGSKTFSVEITEASVAGFDSALGVYEVDEEGGIVDTQILFADVKDGTGPVTIDDVEDGHTLGFFLVQNEADAISTLTETDVLEFVTSEGDAATIADGSDLNFAVNGVDTGFTVFHTLSADLNVDGREHALSELNEAGDTMTVGLEDLLGGGDFDFNDIVFKAMMIDTSTIV